MVRQKVTTRRRSTQDDIDEEEKPLIIKGFDRDMEKTLVSRGVPHNDIPTRGTRINVLESLVTIDPDIPGVMSRSTSAAKQYKMLKSFIEHPLRSSHTMCISSFPSDLRAKYLAVHLMSTAIAQHRDGQHKPGRALPLWYRVYGGFSNPLVDKPIQEVPSLLVITNVGMGSTAAKLEKVRDLLERYSEIPKIVVTGGDAPCNLFANKFHFPLKIGIYLGPDNRIKEM